MMPTIINVIKKNSISDVDVLKIKISQILIITSENAVHTAMAVDVGISFKANDKK
jgi:uncharacterized protein with von Willebrand factor type A (vWA) domain